MSKINFTLNTILILIVTSTVSYSFLFFDKILKNLRDLNTQSKTYLGYSIPYLEKEEEKIKNKSEVLKNFSSKRTISKNSIQSEKGEKQQKKKTTEKKKPKKNQNKKKYKKKKKRKVSKRELSLERRVRILEREIKKLKRERKK